MDVTIATPEFIGGIVDGGFLSVKIEDGIWPERWQVVIPDLTTETYLLNPTDWRYYWDPSRSQPAGV